MMASVRDYSIFMLDAAGRVMGWNDGALRMKGYLEHEILGQHFSKFYTTEDIATGKPDLELEVAAARGSMEDEGWQLRKDGSRFMANVVITALRDDSGGLLGFAKITRDITAQRETERELRDIDARLRLAMSLAEKANQAKSEFLANMSHEIRTPLNAVISLGYLLEHTSLSEEQRQFVAKIQFAGRSLLSVVNNVLDLSKIEAGEMLLEEAGFDLPGVLKDIAQMLLPEASAKGVDLVVELAPALPRLVMGDVARLRQIFTNLLNNAIKFTERGSVTVGAWCAAQAGNLVRVRCEVTDTGIGIDSEVLERLFSPFTQADASTTRRFGGTGLGLSIARRFVELMGGEIGVSSTIGVGSTFWFEIPLTLAKEISAPSLTGFAPQFRILVADPAGEAEVGLGAMVRALGCTPEIARTEEQLRQLVRTARKRMPVDVLILDLGLCSAEPSQLIEQVRSGFVDAVDAEVPPIILVANDSQAYLQVESCMRSHDALLVRPVSSWSLFNAINTAVWKQNGGGERFLQATNLDELHAQWLVDVRVLVVDDSDINLEVARRILEKQGALVATTADGRAAVEYAGRHSLDVILMDVQMPGLDGNQATQLIRQELNLPDLPIIALTAGALLSERQRALDAGMNDFLSKPFDPLTLIRKVRQLVEKARGEPIPMMLVDRPARMASDGSPLIASLDASVVQQMFGEDLPLFKTVLSRMLREYADLALPTHVPLDPRARGELLARAHKLKGSAGMLGATRVMQLAAAVENAFRKDRAVEVIERILGQLASVLTTLREEAQAFLAPQPDRAASPASEGAQGTKHEAVDIEELFELLESHNLRAVDKLLEYAPSLSSLLGVAAFEPLREAIDSLDFEHAAALLRNTGLGGNREASGTG